MKQKELSVLLRVIVTICALIALALALALAVTTAKSLYLDRNWESVYLAAELALFVPLFAALWDMWCIFREIGHDNSFCMENAMRLRRVSFYALADTLLEIATMLLFVLAGGSNGIGTGIGWLLLKLFFVLVGIAMAVACAALSHLTRKAAQIKSENDLTI